MSAPRLDGSQKKAILVDYLNGMPIALIAETYGVHQSYPCLLAKRRGHSVRRVIDYPRRPALSKEVE